jgi:hypothetical protein
MTCWSQGAGEPAAFGPALRTHLAAVHGRHPAD